MHDLYDPIRKVWVAGTPEEQVRQGLIAQMIQELGYPSSLIAVEESLANLPNTSPGIPSRRADLICFGRKIHPHYPLYPLLMIECKAVPLTQSVIDQVVGYNHYVEAFFVGVANQECIQVGWREGNRYRFIDGLPTYADLLASICVG